MGKMRKLLKIEPGVSLGWFVVERITQIINSWATISAIIVGAAMTYLSAITEWLVVWGPVSWGSIGLGAAILTGTLFSLLKLWKAKTDQNKAMERLVNARSWQNTVNPMAKTYEGQRINVRDLTTPLTNTIKGRTFVECQIVGPVNFLLVGSTNILDPQGIACEAVYADNNVFISNAIEVTNCDFRRCEFFNVTFIVLPDHYEAFTEQLALSWITKNPNNLKHINSVNENPKIEPKNEKSNDD